MERLLSTGVARNMFRLVPAVPWCVTHPPGVGGWLYVVFKNFLNARTNENVCPSPLPRPTAPYHCHRAGVARF